MGTVRDFDVAAQKAKGRLKEAVGEATGDESMAARRRGEQVAARMKEAADETIEKTKQAAAELSEPTLAEMEAAEEAARAAGKKDAGS